VSTAAKYAAQVAGILGLVLAAVLAMVLPACDRNSSQDPQVRAVAAVALVGEDLATHRPPAGFCDAAMWQNYLSEPWANAGVHLSPFRIEGQPIVTMGETIQVDFVASMVTTESARARVGMRAFLRKSDPPCVLMFMVRHEPVGVRDTHGENGGEW